MITYGMQKETVTSIDAATKQAVNSVKRNLVALQKAAAEYERSCVAYFKQVLIATGLSQKVVNKETGKVGKIRIVHGRYHSLEYPMELRFFPDDEKPKKKPDKLQQHENGRQILASYFLCMQPNNELSEYLKQNFEPYHE